MSNFLRRILETQVSSHKIKSEFLKVSIALWDISNKFPIGVDTIYKPILILLLSDLLFKDIVVTN